MPAADLCVCGHPSSDHQRLPGHPDGAEECWGSEACDCGAYRSRLDWYQDSDDFDPDEPSDWEISGHGRWWP